MLRRKLKGSSPGQAVLEFALVLPVFLLLVFGIVEMSRIGYSYVTLSNAVRSGTRVASVGGLDSDIVNAIANSAPLLDRNLMTIEIVPDDSGRRSGSSVTVSASYPVSLTTPIISQVIPNPVVINASLSMRIE